MLPRHLWGHIALLIAIVVILTGCGKAPADLVLLTTGNTTRTAVAAAVKEFEAENPGITVQIVNTPGKDYYVKSLTMLAGRAQVDVMWMGQGFGIFAGRGALLDLMPMIESDSGFDLSRYQSEVVGWYRQGQGIYGIPYGVETLVIAYNKDLFDAAGMPYPHSDWTVEEMIAAGRKLTQFNKDHRRIKVAGLGMKEIDYRYFGLTLLTPDHQRFALNTAEGREWLELTTQLVSERILQKGGELESLDRLTGFLNGQVAMMEIASWDIPEVKNRALFSWDVVAIPIGPGGKRAAWASSSGYSIVRSTRKPDLAWQLVKKLTNAGFQKQIVQRTVPVSPSLHEEYLSAHQGSPRHLSELLKMLPYMQPLERIACYQEIEAEWVYWRDQALLGKIPPAKALEQAESHINRILSLHTGPRPQ